MNRLFCLALTAAALAAPPGPRPVRADEFTFEHEHVLGTSMELRVAADSRAAAEGAEARVLAEIERLAKVFSTYDPDSEFSRWQARPAGPEPVSPELLAVLTASDRWRLATDGTFDPRVEALSRAWGLAARADRVPTREELAAARAAFAAPAWRLDPAAGTAERLGEAPLTLNAIAKGFIVDHACAAALDPERGVRGVMVCIGGDLRVVGDLSRRIGVADPRHDSETTEPLAHVELRGLALASSGGYQRKLTIGGQTYSHILDPRTGQPAGGVIASTVIAPRTVDADALATAFSVLPVEASLRLAATLPDVGCLLVTPDGRVHRGGDWRRHEVARPRLVALRRFVPDDPPAGTWQAAVELLVKFEVNRPEGANARGLRRPYVAVWIEDGDGLPVRTLVLWFQNDGKGQRWLPDLRRWYRQDQVRKLAGDANVVETVARATRPPGRYEVIWDGKDDEGQPVDAGSYTLMIEAAREHGTYQLIKTPIVVGPKPFAQDLKGNVEIKGGTVELRRR